jgi:TIGR03009 family protein
MKPWIVLGLVALATPAFAQQPPAAMPPAQPAVPPGFELPREEQAYLDNLLANWEQRSTKVQNFRCAFKRWTYNSFGPAENSNIFSIDAGELSYRAPDRGSFQVKERKVWTPESRAADDTGPIKGAYKDQPATGEHWVCDGKSIYEFKQEQKEIVERPIPPEMQGQRIVDGPLPFLFGAEAAKLKARYWFRIAKNMSNETQVAIEARPKYQVDAANYMAVFVIFDAKHEYLMPKGIVVFHPDGSKDSYQFDLASAQINRQFGQLFEALFSAPRTPIGWTKVLAEPQADPTRQAQGQAPQPR